MMKKVTIFAAIAMTMIGCSSDELVNNSTENTEAPIAFSVEKKNISRGDQATTLPSLESTGHYNFGVWAYKYGTSLTTQKVMDNYLVGYSDGNGVGYSNANATTWASTIGDQKDHKSPWFYEYLGTAEYQNTDASKGYLASQAAYMSANANQYLRYWDLKYTNTNFYAYAPYRATGVSFNESTKIITVANTAQVAGYDDPSLQEFMYAGAQATNADLKDVKLTFKHLGAQVNLRFYEDVRGYKVQIIDVTDANSGIQATPATKSGNTYTKADYYTSCGATIDFTTVGNPTATVDHSTASTTQDNLKFVIPAGTEAGLTSYTSKLSTNYNVIPEAVATGNTQNYAKSSTIYYPVAQPENSKVGFTFHVSYKLIAEDNGEEITVHNARVYVPAKNGSEFIAAWQPNTKYTYTFKITKDSKGTTDPDDTTIDITKPDVPATPTVYPIVFDGATVEDYTIQENGSNF
ncbi:fimbrillin family protein [Prevotella communis]|uniref:fimbrillin family protein n=1 Tax=Prevotella communis TaxID=2913614 RepID=UPI001EDB71E5|nr:fimbrillin family protein [Prevotella communis]UKK67870.1 fimbrillin family protein [Prevotella communis]UKK69994.1 fimbrillin family protein [Prevotella communis]